MRSLVAAGLVLFSASAAHAAEGATFWYELGNLVLLVGVLVFLARKPVLNYLAERRDGIQQNIESSERLLAEAEARLAEWQTKADNLEAEVAEIKETTRRAAEQERDQIVAAARVTAERIRGGAGAIVERELLQARQELREEAADLAVELASKILREQVTDGDRERLVDEFISRVEQGGRA